MFSTELAEYLESKAESGLRIYTESFPVPESADDQIACVISSGESGFPQRRQQYTEIKRIVVTGTAKESIDLAWDLYNILLPVDGSDDLGFNTTNYLVHTVFLNGKPKFIKNQGNLFYAQFILSFLISRDS